MTKWFSIFIHILCQAFLFGMHQMFLIFAVTTQCESDRWSKKPMPIAKMGGHGTTDGGTKENLPFKLPFENVVFFGRHSTKWEEIYIIYRRPLIIHVNDNAQPISFAYECRMVTAFYRTQDDSSIIIYCFHYSKQEFFKRCESAAFISQVTFMVNWNNWWWNRTH